MGDFPWWKCMSYFNWKQIMSCYIKANLFLVFDCGKHESRLQLWKVMPIDVNLEIPTNLYKEQGIWSQNSHSSFGLDQENDHHTKAIVHQEVWVLGLYWEHRGESLWDLFGIILGTYEPKRNQGTSFTMPH